MKEYDFTLKFALRRPDADPDACVEALMREGCDDALIGIGKPGHIALNFIREASSAEEAVISALAAVKRAIPDCRFLEATPDFVGITDIANLLGFSRQNMRKILEKSGTDFPPPVHGGSRPIWHLEPVLSWFARKQSRKIDTALLEISRVNRYCNYAKESGLLDRDLPEVFKRAVA
jgi:predicted DNA-binding transcriptional regulator AlpA